ncbi:MAG: transposase [Nitrospirae bacterium]|nr:transposase [Nitrospirota bacterium]
MKSRRQFSKEYKAKVAIEALKGQRTANEIAQEFGIHVSQVNEWKKQLLDGASEVFKRGQERIAVDQESERDRLYQQIGKLQVEVDWLKKKTLLPVGR